MYALRTRLRANSCWWKITPSGGELCLIEKIIRVGLLTVWGIFGALVEALTIACYLCEGVWSEVVRELWNHPTSESRSGRRDTGPGRYRHLLSLCLLVVRGKWYFLDKGWYQALLEISKGHRTRSIPPSAFTLPSRGSRQMILFGQRLISGTPVNIKGTQDQVDTAICFHSDLSWFEANDIMGWYHAVLEISNKGGQLGTSMSDIVGPKEVSGAPHLL